MKYHTGVITQPQQADESGVASVEFVQVLEDNVTFEPTVLAHAIGMDEGQLSVILNAKQPWVSLKVVDRILMAFDRIDLLGELTFIPGHLKSHAIQMAVYENLDENDQLLVSLEQIAARAEELQGIREMMLSGDAEAFQVARSLARGE